MMFPREELLRAECGLRNIFAHTTEAVGRCRRVSREVDAGYPCGIRRPEYRPDIVRAPDILQEYSNFHTIYHIQNTVYCRYAVSLPRNIISRPFFCDASAYCCGHCLSSHGVGAFAKTRRVESN